MIATVNTKRFLFTQAATDLEDTPDELALYQNVTRGPSFADLTKLEDDLVEKPTIGDPTTVDSVEWHNDYTAVATGLGIFEGALAQKAIGDTGRAATSKEIQLALAVGASFLMMLIVLIFSIRIARSLIRRVAGLRMDALSLALDRLPSVVTRLRRGETVDLKAETPPLRYGFDELGQLGDAFTRVQETAIASAIQEANLRHGFNQVFLNIARRSQTLLHRQLCPFWTRWSAAPRTRTSSEGCFRVDHLATRMRRHARTWSSSPVPRPDGVGAARSRSPTCCARPRPRSRSTHGSASSAYPRSVSPDAPSTTSCTCWPSCWRTRRCSRRRTPRSRCPARSCRTASSSRSRTAASA